MERAGVMAKWTVSDMPTQHGRTAVVTGTGGLGFEVALALARAGAGVVLAGRDRSKGADAVRRIEEQVPSAKIRFGRLDLASLASIAEFAAGLRDQQDSLDLLVNNAGVMVPPQRRLTEDGFELQFGTNHLGHFALTGHLFPLLRNARTPRVIAVSSIAANSGVMDLDDVNAERSYKAMAAYSRSKLACLMFAMEMQRRNDAGAWGVTSIAAHPGIARTDLLHNGPGRWSVPGLARSLLPFLFQPADRGALPTLFAATAPQARSGAYYGPDGLAEMRGYPMPAKIPPLALDEAVTSRLWQLSEDLTGVRFSSGIQVRSQSPRVVVSGRTALA